MDVHCRGGGVQHQCGLSIGLDGNKRRRRNHGKTPHSTATRKCVLELIAGDEVESFKRRGGFESAAFVQTVLLACLKYDPVSTSMADLHQLTAKSLQAHRNIDIVKP